MNVVNVAHFLRTVALALAALLPIINPPGAAPIFLSMTPGASALTRRALARRVAINSCLLLIAAMFMGSYVLAFFGLSLAVVKIAGGTLITAAGWRLINAREPHDPALVKTPAEMKAIAHLSFYPLTFPLTIGPGSVSVAITLGAREGAAWLPAAATIVGILIASIAVYLCYRFASRLLDVLGETGSIVLLRLSAFILLAVGVQILSDGLAERFVFLTLPIR